MATYAEQIKTLKKKIANFDMTGGGKTSQKAKTLEQWKKELKRLQSLPETNKEQLSTLRDELKRLEEGGAYKPTRTANWMPGSGAHTNRVKTLKNTISDLGGDLEDKANPVVSIDDKEVEVSSDPKILSSSIRGKQKSNLSDQALSREEESGEVGENPNYFQQLGGVDQGYWMNGQWISNMTDVDRQNLRDFSIWKNGAIEKKKLEQTGGQEYVTDYETAIRNSRRDGLSFGQAEQYYGEDVLDSAGQRVKKSNVFTRRMNEDGTYGDPMGVMTRKQRLAEDLARAEAAIPKPDKTEDKKEKDTSTGIKTEPNVGSEINNTGEGGKVFTPPTPLSDEYKSLFNPTRV